MSKPNNVVLIGFMGTGKTSVGKRVARRLNMRFLDMDSVIEQRQGKPISRIFADEGEAFFRDLERRLARELAVSEGLVVGTGGGIVLNADNLRDFERTGLVVCLSATPEAILARVGHSTHRPLLAGDDKIGTIRALLAKRQALYDAIPNQVNTTALSLDQVVAEIIRMYEAASAKSV